MAIRDTTNSYLYTLSETSNRTQPLGTPQSAVALRVGSYGPAANHRPAFGHMTPYYANEDVT